MGQSDICFKAEWLLVFPWWLIKVIVVALSDCTLIGCSWKRGSDAETVLSLWAPECWWGILAYLGDHVPWIMRNWKTLLPSLWGCHLLFSPSMGVVETASLLSRFTWKSKLEKQLLGWRGEKGGREKKHACSRQANRMFLWKGLECNCVKGTALFGN